MHDVSSRGAWWWVWPVVAAASIGVLAVALLASPAFNVLARTAGNVLGSGEPSAVRIFVVTHGHRSPLAAIALIVWQGVVFPLPDIPALRASGLLWGPALGFVVNWIGLLCAAILTFLVGRALVGIPIAHFMPPKTEPRGLARRIILGLRLIPFVPQDLVSLVAGTTRTRFVDSVLPTARGRRARLLYAAYPEDAPS
jgi:uncharacterized membrane protein YdjX (TVP38/TMEM64 family)